jgi:hypothetical protein
MKAILAAVTLCLAAGAFAHEPSKPAPWLVAQSDRRMPMCKQEERDVPSGTTTCREGRSYICSGRGSWETTGKPC